MSGGDSGAVPMQENVNGKEVVREVGFEPTLCRV